MNILFDYTFCIIWWISCLITFCIEKINSSIYLWNYWNEDDNSAILKAIIPRDSIIPMGFWADLICSRPRWQLLTNTRNSCFYRFSLICLIDISALSVFDEKFNFFDRHLQSVCSNNITVKKTTNEGNNRII